MMSTITLVMYSSTSIITLIHTRVRVLEYEYMSTITPSLVWCVCVCVCACVCLFMRACVYSCMHVLVSVNVRVCV